MDLGISAVSIAALWPVVAMVAAAMRLRGDRGPVFYRGCRVGEHGRPIKVLKFRTMYPNAIGGGLTVSDDHRVTPLGRVMRRHKIDELPQLWNVLRGELSLVGPRPEDPRHVDWNDPLHRKVFSAKPGMTGPAQLRYHREEEILTTRDAADTYRTTILPEKLRLDAEYLDRRTLRLDARILVATARRLLRP